MLANFHHLLGLGYRVFVTPIEGESARVLGGDTQLSVYKYTGLASEASWGFTIYGEDLEAMMDLAATAAGAGQQLLLEAKRNGSESVPHNFESNIKGRWTGGWQL
jgi:hypothetical protein